MLQQINFYKLLSRKSKFQLTWQVVLSSYTLFILVFVFMYGIELWQKKKITTQYTALNNQLLVLEKRLTVLTKQYPISDALALENANTALQYQLSKKNKILSLLSSKKDFSNYLSGLANVDANHVWLTEIIFNNVGQAIMLKGFALQSAMVETMLVQLGMQSAFSSLKFEIQNIKENPSPTSFEISAKQEILL